MLKSLELENVGPVPELALELVPRMDLFTVNDRLSEIGDNNRFRHIIDQDSPSAEYMIDFTERRNE